MSGGGSTGPRPQPATITAALTKHTAVARRSTGEEMKAVNEWAAPSPISVLAGGQPAPRWLVSLGASILGPVLLSLAFPPVNLGFFAFIALVPLFLLWAKSSWKQALAWGALAGFVTFALVFSWMTHSLHEFIGGLWVLALFLLCFLSGLNIAVMAVAVSLLARREFRATLVFAAPAVWLLAETWRTRGSLGVPFGELGLGAAHLSWLAPIAAFGGVYLLSGIFALASAALAGVIGGTPGARRAGIAALCVLALLIGLGDFARSRVAVGPAHLRVAVAQGNVSQLEKWSPAVLAGTLRTYALLTRHAKAEGARLVVWPETAVTGAPLQDAVLMRLLANIARRSHVWIITGTIDRPSQQVYYNALLDLSPHGAVAGVYHKRWLVPWAEYLPLAGLLGGIPIMSEVSRFTPGPGPHLLPAAGVWWGPLICYESAFAPYARATANAGADALVVATDDAWFGGTSGPVQHADISVLDAISTGRWVVRAADTGISMIVDPKGKVVASLPVGVAGVIVANAGPPIQTPYDRFGIAWLLALAVVAIIVAAFVRPAKLEPPGWRSKRGAP
jgi:apolipoprotein N-acyltransferase